MEAKQIEARIGDWSCLVTSVVTKGDIRHFSQNFFQTFFQSSIYTYIKRQENIY